MKSYEDTKKDAIDSAEMYLASAVGHTFLEGLIIKLLLAILLK